jgi:hypothetical protein
MFFTRIRQKAGPAGARKSPVRPARQARPVLEWLEGRVVPSSPGDLLWTQQIGSANSEVATQGVSADGTGVYVAGYTFGALPGQTSAGGIDAFVTKYDLTGHLLWTRQFGTASIDFANGVSADGSGVYVAGTNTVFLRKYDPSGNLLWTRQLGPSTTAAYAVSAGAWGVYVAGRTSGALPGQTNAGGTDAFVAKYDAAGNLLWTRQFGTTSNDVANGVSADGSGVYVAGGTTTFAGSQAFVAKYDAAGHPLWSRQLGSGEITASGVSADGTGVYVAGGIDGALPGQTNLGGGDAYVVKYDAGGNLLWGRQFGSAGGDEANGVSADGSGVHVAGTTNGVLPGQTSAGAIDAFVAKYDPDGNPLWTCQFGSADDEFARGVSGGSAGVYVAGLTSSLAGGGFLDRLRGSEAPPVILSRGISSSGPGGAVTVKSVLTAQVTGNDPDGEAVSYAYHWYRNGAAVAGATSATLDLGGLVGVRRGDKITVTVTPSDASATGTGVSVTVTVVNSPYATAAYSYLAWGCSYAGSAYAGLGTPAAYSAWVYASYAWAWAQYAYAVDPGQWTRARAYAAVACQFAYSAYLASGNDSAYYAYLDLYYGWLYARLAVSSP